MSPRKRWAATAAAVAAIAVLGVWLFENASLPRLRAEFIPWMHRLERYRDALEQTRSALRARSAQPGDPEGIAEFRAWAWKDLDLALGWHPNLASAFIPVIQMPRPISPLAWMPLAILWFGVSEAAPGFLIFLGAFFPIVVASMNGVRSVPAMYLQAGRNFGLSTPRLLARVVFPAALPQILVGLRIALGIAWIVVVAAEMIAVDSGLGYPHHRL